MIAEADAEELAAVTQKVTHWLLSLALLARRGWATVSANSS
jgi:hypothetical protein